MNYRLYYTSFFLLSVLSFVSCKKDFLDVTSSTQFLYRENFVRDLNSLDEYLNGLYLEFNGKWTAGQAYPEYVADNFKPVNDFNLDRMAKYSWAQNPNGNGTNFSANNMSGTWQDTYRVIRSCDFVIDEADKYKSENAVRADYIKGQALFIRAIMHYKLVNIFAQPYQFTSDASHLGVPYITDANLSAPYSRQTVKEVYDALISDLTTAIALMERTITRDVRYIGADAARALLARIYLFKSDYAKALDIAKDVCAKFPLMTIANGYPEALFDHKPMTESEVIYQATPSESGPYSLGYTFFLGYYLRQGTSFWVYNATSDIATLLQESATDARKAWVGLSNNNWLVYKFPVGVAGIHLEANADYYDPVIRSSEMYLTVAEAAAKTGDESTARQYLNAIRKRADPQAIEITSSGEQLLTAIYKERRKELCFENFRLFDLQRWKLGIHRTDVFPGYPTDLPYPSSHAIAPIPRHDIELLGLRQNEGY